MQQAQGPARQSGALIVVSGPTAAGKTTVAHEIARRRARSVHVDGDDVQRLVVSGSIAMDAPPPPGALEQLRLRFRAALSLATLYRAAGFDAIVSDNLFGDEVGRFLDLALQPARSGPIHFVMLTPSVEAIRRRYASRPGGGYSATLTPQVLQAAVEQSPRVGLWLDSSDQTASQTADEVLRRLPEAWVDPDDRPW